jgi:hypothetical protein
LFVRGDAVLNGIDFDGFVVLRREKLNNEAARGHLYSAGALWVYHDAALLPGLDMLPLDVIERGMDASI